jgi:type III pantothenate kinase
MTHFVAMTLGNSTAALYADSGGALSGIQRTHVDKLETFRGPLADLLKPIAGDPVRLAVASVNPAALDRLRRLVDEVAGAAPLVAGADFPIPMRADVDEPAKVGVDRLLGALAAVRRAGAPCVVVDAGTAITVNAISADGVFLGGAIMPGLGMMARFLAQGTAGLPTIILGHVAPPLGRNTVDAMAAGIFHGGAGAVTALVAGARSVVGADAPVILTGGDAGRIVDLLPADCRTVVPELVMEGLVLTVREWRNR